MDQALMLRIRERAYHIWTANGGDADQNWLRAETEILNNSAAEPPEVQPQKRQPSVFRRKAKKTASAGLDATTNAATSGGSAAITPNRVLRIGGASKSPRPPVHQRS
jgi:hypothetical protein